MKYLPQILKAERDLTGLLTLDMIDPEPVSAAPSITAPKPYARAFTELRGGIAWPFRSVPGYLCILGLFAGMRFGTEKATMLLYESKYPDAMELMTDAYNKAHDLRFQIFYTDCSKVEWKGFIHEFSKKISIGLGGRNIRLKQSPFPNDFVLGKDLIKRVISQKGFILPTAAVLTEQLANIRTSDLETEHPEYSFPAANAFRYLVVGWENDLWAQRTGRTENDISPMGWA